MSEPQPERPSESLADLLRDSIVAARLVEWQNGASWIRRMFEEGNRLRAQFGAENVYDFSLGNPHLEPPAALTERLRDLTTHPPAGMHRYMPIPGFPGVRAKLAEAISRQESVQKSVQVPMAHVLMTGGAASGLNIVARALLNPGDKVILFAPIFPEYTIYVGHAGGVCQQVQTTAEFDLDLSALEAALDESTRMVLLNSPNNPTGRVYPETSIVGLVGVLERANRHRRRPIVLVSDDPYRRMVYDGARVPTLMAKYPVTILVGSFSKDLGLAGERIGYLAVHPEFPQANAVMNALTFCLRTLGFVNAPALFQLAVADVLDTAVDIAAYQSNRDLLYDGLVGIGYQVVKPEGAFFLFPRSPLDDDRAFVECLARHRILAVPGTGFARSGYFRLSYAVAPEVIKAALPGFAQAFAECQS